MTTRPLAGFQERFLMFVGVLALLAVEFKVVLRPEISIGGSEGMWVKCSLFAMTLILMTYSVADDSEEFWISLPILCFVYGSSFLYMYIHKGVEAGVLVLITLALTMLVVSVMILVVDGTKLGWSEVVRSGWRLACQRHCVSEEF